MRHLDTCIAIAFLNGNQSIAERVKFNLPDLAISSIVLGELLYGVKASARRADNLKKLGQFLQLVSIVDYNRTSAEACSQLRLSLRQKGRPSGDIDMLIAAAAIADNAVLVTDNVKHFQHIENLKIENWLREQSASIP